jgi:hypothetical protein
MYLETIYKKWFLNYYESLYYNKMSPNPPQTLYQQASNGTLKVGDTLMEIRNESNRHIVKDIDLLPHDAGYRITFNDGMSIGVSKEFEDEWKKQDPTGGKKKRKSRRNKKTKRGKSQRRR